jgi:hypothetical protein
MGITIYLSYWVIQNDCGQVWQLRCLFAFWKNQLQSKNDKKKKKMTLVIIIHET